MKLPALLLLALLTTIELPAEKLWRVAGQPISLSDSHSETGFLDSRTIYGAEAWGGARRSFWDAETGERIAGRHHLPHARRTLDLSSDRSLALVYDANRALFVERVDGTGQQLALPQALGVEDARFFDGGQVAIAISIAGTGAVAQAFDVVTGNVIWSLELEEDRAAVLMPRLNRVVALRSPYPDAPYTTVEARDAATGEVVGSAAVESTGFISDILRGPPSRYALVASGESTIIFDPQDGSAAEIAQPLDAFSMYRFLGDDSILLAFHAMQGAFALYRCEDGASLGSLEEFGTPELNFYAFYHAAASPDGATLYLENAGALAAWDLATKSRRRLFPVESSPIRAIAVSPNGAVVATTHESAKTALWDAATGEKLDSADASGPLGFNLAFSPDGSMLLAGNAASRLSTLDLHDGLGETVITRGKARRAAYVRDLDCFAIGYSDGGMQLRDPDDFAVLSDVGAGSGGLALDISPASGAFLTSQLSIRDPSTGATLWSGDAFKGNYSAGWISDDGARVAAFDPSASRIRVIDTESSELLASLDLQVDEILVSAGFSPDGLRFAVLRNALVGSHDRLTTYDLSATPPSIASIEAPNGSHDAIYSRDSQELRVVFSTLGELSLIVYAAATGELLREFDLGLDAAQATLHESTDDEELFVARGNGKVALVDVAAGRVVGRAQLEWSSNIATLSNERPAFAAARDGRRFIYMTAWGDVSAWKAGNMRATSAATIASESDLWIRFPTREGGSYLIESSLDLIDWTEHAEIDQPTLPEHQAKIPPPLPGQPFFGRVWETEE